MARRHHVGDTLEAYQRSEALLKSFLCPEQWKDWEAWGAFNLRGSDGALYRIVVAQGGRNYCHGYPACIIDQGRLGSNVWAQFHYGVLPSADHALTLMLHVMDNVYSVARIGCHDRYSTAPHDYGGAI
jgi:hypothetical protein